MKLFAEVQQNKIEDIEKLNIEIKFKNKELNDVS